MITCAINSSTSKVMPSAMQPYGTQSGAPHADPLTWPSLTASIKSDHDFQQKKVQKKSAGYR